MNLEGPTPTAFKVFTSKSGGSTSMSGTRAKTMPSRAMYAKRVPRIST